MLGTSHNATETLCAFMLACDTENRDEAFWFGTAVVGDIVAGHFPDVDLAISLFRQESDARALREKGKI